MATKKGNSALLPEEEFFVQAIRKLRNNGYKGIHSVFSGFNAAFREYYNTDPIEATKRLAEEGKLVVIPRKGGVMLYLPADAPKSGSGNGNGKKALSKIFEGF